MLYSLCGRPIRRTAFGTVCRLVLQAVCVEVCCVAWSVAGVAAWAQAVPPAKVTAAPLETAFTYNVTRDDVTTGSNFWMQGGSIEVHGQFWRGLGAVAEVTGLHTGNINHSGVGLDLVTATFGPRYTVSLAHTRYSFFGQVLTGEAFGSNSTFPAPAAVLRDANGLAVKLGGGVNLSLSPRLALRAVEVSWLRSQLPNATNDVQNNLQLGTGVVLRLP